LVDVAVTIVTVTLGENVRFCDGVTRLEESVVVRLAEAVLLLSRVPLNVVDPVALHVELVVFENVDE
jgi:hypothetical protein